MIGNKDFNKMLNEALKQLEKKTNADRIRAMTDEELAVFLYGLVNEFGCMNHDCLDFNYCKVHSGEHRYDGWLDWLKEVSE